MNLRNSHLNLESKQIAPSLNPNSVKGVSEQDEHAVWDKFISGDDESLVYIYRKYADILYRYCRQFTVRQELIKDCIQELFFELIEKRSNLSSVKTIKGYLFVAIKRKLINNLKKEERLQHESQGFLFTIDESAVPLISTFEEKDLKLIKIKLNKLPVNQREVILLHFYEGLTYDEIAEIMGIKVRSARSLTYRALDSLNKELSPFKDSLYLIFACFSIS